jgi:hypothetical protein
MNPRVTSAVAQKDFTLLITFANGERKFFDVKPYLNIGVFTSLKNFIMFSTAHAEHGIVVWQNNVDFDPDTLYIEGVPA